jgi:hypothetical protein
MYGISNSQQQGGGGGGAASYKAIKSTITPSDWQEVAKPPYFVGEDAMTWAVNEYGEHEKYQTTKLGLVSGKSYAITVVFDGHTYTQTAVAESNEVDGIGIIYNLSPEGDMYVDIYDDNTGSGCAIEVEATSFVITKFEGEGFGTIIQATISDSAIKVNSAVTLYVNTSEKIAVGEKTNGSITLTADSIPAVSIPYNLEIVGTDTEGLFEIVNGYIPEIPDTPSGVPQWHTIYESSTPVIKAELSEAIQAGKLYKITISGQEFITWAVNAENLVLSIPSLGTVNGVAKSIYNSVYQFDCGIKSYDSTSTANTFKLKTGSQYMIDASGIQDVQFLENDTTSRITFTKVEVYR